ncbi:MAG: DnaD domain protein [Eubacterium sp.]|nr:DnaD domain protein [Eubacterium sp.]
MGIINVSSQAVDFTNISNNFIEYYMTDANGDFVKLYLYLAMLSQSGRPITITDIADHMSCTEKDVCRAIRYWIKADVLSLSYNDEGEVTGITLRTLKRPEVELTSDLRLVDFGLSVEGKKKRNAKDNAISEEKSKIIDLSSSKSSDENDSSQNTSEKELEAESNKKDTIIKSDETVSNPEDSLHAPKKKQPTKAEIASKLEDNELSNLISEAEAYCERGLSQKELNSLIYIKDQLGFSFDLCEYLLEYCAEVKKTSFYYIEAVAKNWYEEGITNRGDAIAYTERYLTLYSSIMKTMGITNRYTPAPAEKKYINKWIEEFGFSEAIIKEACNRAVLNSPNDVTFKYVNGILKDWFEKGVHTFKDINKIDEEFKAKKIAASMNTSSRYTSSKASSKGSVGQVSGDDDKDKLLEIENFFLNGGNES